MPRPASSWSSRVEIFVLHPIDLIVTCVITTQRDRSSVWLFKRQVRGREALLLLLSTSVCVGAASLVESSTRRAWRPPELQLALSESCRHAIRSAGLCQPALRTLMRIPRGIFLWRRWLDRLAKATAIHSITRVASSSTRSMRCAHSIVLESERRRFLWCLRRCCSQPCPSTAHVVQHHALRHHSHIKPQPCGDA